MTNILTTKPYCKKDKFEKSHVMTKYSYEINYLQHVPFDSSLSRLSIFVGSRVNLADFRTGFEAIGLDSANFEESYSRAMLLNVGPKNRGSSSAILLQPKDLKNAEILLPPFASALLAFELVVTKCRLFVFS